MAHKSPHFFLLRVMSPVLLVSQMLGCSQQTPPSASQAASASVASPSAPASVSADPANDKKLHAELMAAIFGPKYRPASGDALASLPDINERHKLSEYLLTAEASHMLEDGRMVLVANAQPPAADGPSHGQPGLLNVYFLRKTGNSWQVLQRFENLAEMGSNGVFGAVEWLNLAPAKPAFLLHHGWTGQGQTISSFSLFALGQDKVQELTPEGIPEHTDNDGDCLEDTDKCWNLEGKWRLEPARNASPYQDIIVDYSGEQSTRASANSSVASSAASASVVRNSVKISEHARYGFDGKQYRLIEGKALTEGPVN